MRSLFVQLNVVNLLKCYCWDLWVVGIDKPGTLSAWKRDLKTVQGLPANGHDLLVPLLCDSQIKCTIRDELHWLPVVQSIHFRQCLPIYLGVHCMAPAHIVEICVKFCFDCECYQLRSAVRFELVVPPAKEATFGRRSFKYNGSSPWNVSPHDIRDLPCISSV